MCNFPKSRQNTAQTYSSHGKRYNIIVYSDDNVRVEWLFRFAAASVGVLWSLSKTLLYSVVGLRKELLFLWAL